jgi:hypothetical protein
MPAKRIVDEEEKQENLKDDIEDIINKLSPKAQIVFTNIKNTYTSQEEKQNFLNKLSKILEKELSKEEQQKFLDKIAEMSKEEQQNFLDEIAEMSKEEILDKIAEKQAPPEGPVGPTGPAGPPVLADGQQGPPEGPPDGQQGPPEGQQGPPQPPPPTGGNLRKSRNRKYLPKKQKQTRKKH